MSEIKWNMRGDELDITDDAASYESVYSETGEILYADRSIEKHSLFEQADRLMRLRRFDSAEKIYRSIAEKFPDEAEAYWRSALCHYGIEYVAESPEGWIAPAFHWRSDDSILENADFEKACRKADLIARRQYRNRARIIEDIRNDILGLSDTEKPYEIIICCREIDENGKRTADSILAQEVYEALIEAGIHTFFARITLKDKPCISYEPYLFTALNSAGLMLVFGTAYEYICSGWEENMWARYLELMEKDKERRLISCLKGMDAGQLPRELTSFESRDMGSPEAVSRLVADVKKDMLLDCGQKALEWYRWSAARKIYEQLLDIEPDNAEAYIGRELAEERVKNLSGFVRKLLAEYSTANIDRQLYEQKPDQAYITAEVIRYAIPGYLEKSTIEELYGFKVSAYIADASERRELFQAAMAKWDACLSQAEKYAAGDIAETLRKAKSELVSELKKPLEEAETAEEGERKKLEAEYALKLNEADNKAEELYNDAVRRKAAAEKLRKKQFRICACLALAAAAIAAAVLGYRFILENVFAQRDSYREAVELKEAGDYTKAAIAFGKAGDYADAREQSYKLWNDIAPRDSIALCSDYTVAVRSDGTVAAAGTSEYGECDVDGWTDIISIAADRGTTVGLKADGTVTVTGVYAEEISPIIKNWTDIVAVETNGHEVAGLRADGTVVYTMGEGNGAGDDSYWNDITALSAGNISGVLAGVRSDGTVAVLQRNDPLGRSDAAGWADMSEIYVGEYRTVGLRADGTVMSTGNEVYDKYDVGSWTDIVQVSVGDIDIHAAGLRSNGTVVAAGDNQWYECEVGSWTDIVQISAGGWHTVGLKSDGTVVASGKNEYGQCDVGDWTDIVAIYTGDERTVGLKSDGTLVAAGTNWHGEADVEDWTDIRLP